MLGESCAGTLPRAGVNGEGKCARAGLATKLYSNGERAPSLAFR